MDLNCDIWSRNINFFQLGTIFKTRMKIQIRSMKPKGWKTERPLLDFIDDTFTCGLVEIPTVCLYQRENVLKAA